MEPLDLHYNRGKLIRLALVSLLVLALTVAASTSDFAPADYSHRRDAWLTDALGPGGSRAVLLLGAALSAAMLFLFGRAGFSDQIAARANAKGLKINSMFGNRHFRWVDIEPPQLRKWGSSAVKKDVLQIVCVPGRGKGAGLVVAWLKENREDVQAWVDGANAIRCVQLRSLPSSEL